MSKILSLIVPTYNMEALLRHTLDSLLVPEEKLPFLEVLVVNDGSKDSSLSIAQEYERKFAGVFFAIDKPNGNYGSCINCGLQRVTGKYVKVLDADDSFDTENLASFLDYLTNQDVDLVISDFSIVNESGKKEECITYDLPESECFGFDRIPSKMCNWFFHQAITYKASLFEGLEYRQTEGISYTDDEWTFQPMLNVKTIQYFPKEVYLYLRGREGQTCDEKIMRRSLDQRTIVAKENVAFFEKNRTLYSQKNFDFVFQKLLVQVAMLYNHYLSRSYSRKGIPDIIKFDSYLKETCSDVYERLNSYSNSYGWRYIRQWRRWNYFAYCPALIIMRMKGVLYGLMGKNINALNMPMGLRRIK